MINDSCTEASQSNVPVVPSVEVIGLHLILRSNLLSELFAASKQWILSLWSDQADQIKNITILEKNIGRNGGFILKVNCIDPSDSKTFYAKVQYASMDTVLIHHLLKNMKCGPERFHIALFYGNYYPYHGVITEGVEGWNMARSLTQDQTKQLMNEKKTFFTTTFLLTLLTELGRFGNIPNNRDNWGFIDEAVESIPYPRMSLIDFARGGEDRHTFDSTWNFLTNWIQCVLYLFQMWEPVCGPIEDLQLFQQSTEHLRMSLVFGLEIVDQVDHFAFLQSAHAFIAILQSACDASALWLHETIQQAHEKTQENLENKNQGNASSATVSADTSKLLQPFRNVPRPNTTGLEYSYVSLVNEHLKYVDEWNKSVPLFCKWFPFPVQSDTPTVSVPPSTDVVGTACKKADVADSEPVLSVESMQI